MILIYRIITSTIWDVVLNLMKRITNRSQNLFSWNKNQKCLNSTGSGYDSNMTNYLTPKFSIQRLKNFVFKFNIPMWARKFEVVYLFRLNLIWRQGSMLGFTLEHKANSGFIFTSIVLSIAQDKPSLKRIWQDPLSLEKILFSFFFFY